MPNESLDKGKQHGKKEPATLCLLEIRPDYRFIFVLRYRVTAPCYFTLVKSLLFHILVGIKVHNQTVPIRDEAFVMLPCPQGRLLFT